MQNMYIQNIIDIKKQRNELDNTFATAVLHCVEIIHVESTKALHACYLCVGLLSISKVNIGVREQTG